MRSFLIRGVSALAIVGALAFSNRAMADLSINTGTATYAITYTPTTSSTAQNPPGLFADATPPAVIPNATATAIGWTTSASSSWIGLNNVGTGFGTNLDGGAGHPGLYEPGFNAASSSPEGLFFYSTTFFLGAGPHSLTGGLWASDNQGVAIFLNGHNEGQVNVGFTNFVSFTVNSADLNANGNNTLIFELFNEQTNPPHNSPSGLNVQGTVTGITTPEPATVAMVASVLPIGLIGAWVRRRRSQVRLDETASV